jgi:hypothetical protein
VLRVSALIVVELPDRNLHVDLAELLDAIRDPVLDRYPSGVTINVVTGPKADAVLAVLTDGRDLHVSHP